MQFIYVFFPVHNFFCWTYVTNLVNIDSNIKFGKYNK